MSSIVRVSYSQYSGVVSIAPQNVNHDKISQLSSEFIVIRSMSNGFIPIDKKVQLMEQGVTSEQLHSLNDGIGRLLGGMLPTGRYNKNDPTNSNAPPEAQGVYRITSKAGDVRYVGETNNLARRETEHETSGKLKGTENFEWKQLHGNTSTERRKDVETGLIHKYDPPRNQVKLPENTKH